MGTDSKQFAAKHARGTNDESARRKEWKLAVKLSLVAVAIFGTIIFLGMWI